MSDASSSQASGSFIHTKGDTTDNKPIPIAPDFVDCATIQVFLFTASSKERVHSSWQFFIFKYVFEWLQLFTVYANTMLCVSSGVSVCVSVMDVSLLCLGVSVFFISGLCVGLFSVLCLGCVSVLSRLCLCLFLGLSLRSVSRLCVGRVTVCVSSLFLVSVASVSRLVLGLVSVSLGPVSRSVSSRSRSR
eukprot:gene3433-13488_t